MSWFTLPWLKRLLSLPTSRRDRFSQGFHDFTPASAQARSSRPTGSSRGSSQQTPAAVRMGIRLMVVSLCALVGWGLTQLGQPAASYDTSNSLQALGVETQAVPLLAGPEFGSAGDRPQPISASLQAQSPDSQPSGSGQTGLKQITTTTDPVPPQLELGHQLYLETCATCHVGVPPAVLPQQSWIDILQDTQHYGVQLPPLVDPGRLLIAQYLVQFSRSLQEEERTPYRIRNSKTFKALHPRVEFETPLVVNSCVSCHPGAPDFNYRLLSPEWQDAP